jgi:hypothetical protein
MLLATLLLLCPFSQTADTANNAANPPVEIATTATPDSKLSESLPSVPQPKVATDHELAADNSNTSSDNGDASSAAPDTVVPSTGHFAMSVKPAVTRPYDTAFQRHLWYGLAAAGSGMAFADAYSTRRAITQANSYEVNPLLRPFSHSGVLYAATQVSPLLMDFLGKRMMMSRSRTLRTFWWLPQAAGTGVSTAAAVHNFRLVH